LCNNKLVGPEVFITELDGALAARDKLSQPL
jgi:hypothetical protein